MNLGGQGNTIQLITHDLASSISLTSSHALYQTLLWSPASLAFFQALELAMVSFPNYPSPRQLHLSSDLTPNITSCYGLSVSVPRPQLQIHVWKSNPQCDDVGDGTFGRQLDLVAVFGGQSPTDVLIQSSTLSLSATGNTAVYEPGSQPSPGTKPASELNLDLTSRTVRNKCCLSHPVDGILIAAQTDKDTFSEFPSQTSLTFPLSCAQSFSVYFSNWSICYSCYIIYVCEEVQKWILP